MPRIRGEQYIRQQTEKFKKTNNWDYLDNAQSISSKHEFRNTPKPKILYHGSPYKIKKGQKIEPRGPMFYNTNPKSRRARLAVHATDSRGEAKQVYAKESDHGGINKNRYGKKIQPKVFAEKGYIYEINTDKHKGWMKQYHGGTEWHHWASYHAQGWDKRSSVRFKGKVPITRNEAIGVGAGIALVGGSYAAYRHFHNRKQADRSYYY